MIDRAATLALFLTERTGSPLGVWVGRMRAVDQRALFGRVIGKGRIIIDGTAETVTNRVIVCFGHDYDDRNTTRWRDL